MIAYSNAAAVLLIIAGVALLATSVLGMGSQSAELDIVTLENNEANYQQFVLAEIEDDKCAVPDGYTEKDWKEHMGHHPDRYEGCL